MKPSEMLDLFIENNFDVLPVHKITDLCGIQSKVAQLEAKNAALKRENGRLAEYRDSIEGWMWKYHGTDRTSRCRICGGKYPVHDAFGCSLADALPEDLNP